MNYIQLGDLRIELTEEQVKQIKDARTDEQITLSSVGVGETFKIGDVEFIVLEQMEDTVAVITKDLAYTDEEFGKNNKYDGSIVDILFSDFLVESYENCDADSFVEHTVDLTSDDGLKDYGTVKRRMSLLTAEMYRKYVYVLDKYKPDKWWWLATAYSTSTHDDDDWCKCVAPSGRVINNVYDNYDGVRPFCILKSNIFVSK